MIILTFKTFSGGEVFRCLLCTRGKGGLERTGTYGEWKCKNHRSKDVHNADGLLIGKKIRLTQAKTQSVAVEYSAKDYTGDDNVVFILLFKYTLKDAALRKAIDGSLKNAAANASNDENTEHANENVLDEENENAENADGYAKHEDIDNAVIENTEYASNVMDENSSHDAVNEDVNARMTRDTTLFGMGLNIGLSTGLSFGFLLFLLLLHSRGTRCLLFFVSILHSTL